MCARQDRASAGVPAYAGAPTWVVAVGTGAPPGRSLQVIRIVGHQEVEGAAVLFDFRKPSEGFVEAILSRDGLVIPNPGYGDPLRPENILTPAGRTVAPFCKELVNVASVLKEKYLLQSKWALPVLFAVEGGEMRFSELKSCLAPITPRALSEELKTLNQMGHVRRKIVEEFPPVSIYLLTPKARDYAEIYEKHRRALANLPDSRR